MAFFDLSLESLRDYRPDVAEPADFDEFWAATLKEARAFDLDPVFEQVETGLTMVTSYDVTFRGWGGHPIKAWLTVPRFGDGPFPIVVQYQGYNGGRGIPQQQIGWPNYGYAHLMMDTRGQGSGWLIGHTPDPVGSGPQHAGFMTRGITDPAEYYYRRVYTDAVRAIETARVAPGVDGTRVAVGGGSQGGGITIAAAGLVGGLVGALPDVPFLCHFERAIGLTDADPYAEIARYLTVHRRNEEQVYRTLSYFDGVNLARRATAPALFSTALMDQICPPSTVYAAYNAWNSADKDIRVYRFNGHEGGSYDQSVEHATWLGSRVLRG
ncbi:MAG: prolyl oligopeptidase family serine peptidase [Hamadaea sp.]|uniref:acetylxylan esterase n=1 Tax=Hamadaea sp. TaxID=2024425 RepID=UPI00185A4ECD|nr:acetylxylan esterase [Hamadaea sp.]NUR72014.1 prolyl oligopeptidase family serine peptidase [Hamadaea sp.]NUT22621.1 prolyl oligopeptidase family serine peptidase [Hamadaea sp.]